MTLRQYILFMTFGTLLCYVSWFFIIFTVDPEKNSAAVLFFFYLSLFLALIGTFAVLGSLVKIKILKDDKSVFRQIKKVFKQSIFLSILIVSALLLRQYNLLTWLNGILLIVFILILENLFFKERRKTQTTFLR